MVHCGGIDILLLIGGWDHNGQEIPAYFRQDVLEVGGGRGEDFPGPASAIIDQYPCTLIRSLRPGVNR